MNKHVTPPRRKNQGFTLIEMLIVVAIIAILVAVSIPIVGNSLERARIATDAANERAAKAEFMLCYLNGKLTPDATAGSFPGNSGGTLTHYGYDAANGKLVDTDALIKGIDGYGKCNKGSGASGSTTHKDYILVGTISDAGDLTLGWIAEGTNTDPSASTLHNGTVDS